MFYYHIFQGERRLSTTKYKPNSLKPGVDLSKHPDCRRKLNSTVPPGSACEGVPDIVPSLSPGFLQPLLCPCGHPSEWLRALPAAHQGHARVSPDGGAAPAPGAAGHGISERCEPLWHLQEPQCGVGRLVFPHLCWDNPVVCVRVLHCCLIGE